MLGATIIKHQNNFNYQVPMELVKWFLCILDLNVPCKVLFTDEKFYFKISKNSSVIKKLTILGISDYRLLENLREPKAFIVNIIKQEAHAKSNKSGVYSLLLPVANTI